jgi:hypothetical protein
MAKHHEAVAWRWRAARSCWAACFFIELRCTLWASPPSITAFVLPALLCQSVRAALLRPAQVPGRGTSPVLRKCWSVRCGADMASARWRIVLASPWRAAQSCRSPCPQEGALRQWQGNRHHCLPLFDGLYRQSVGKAEYRHAKAIGFGSLSHRAGGAVASSVTMCPRESLRFVTEAHRHLSPVCEAGCASQPQRRSTALAESHQMKASASQDGSQSAVALGVGHGSLAHRAGIPVRPSVLDLQLRQNYITPHCIKCMSSHSQAPFVALHRFAPFGFTQQALCKIAFAGAVASRLHSPAASRLTCSRLSP